VDKDLFRRNNKYSSALIFVSFHQGKERSHYPARVRKSFVKGQYKEKKEADTQLRKFCE